MQTQLEKLSGTPFRQPCAANVRRRLHTACNRRGLHVLAAVKRGSDKTIICSKTLVVRKGEEEAAQQLCREVLDFSRQRMSDRSNGILAFDVNHDLTEPNVIHFWEQYTTNSKLGEHNTTPEFTKFMEQVQDYTEEPVGMILYEMKNGQLSNACIQGGPKGEGGLDDATGAGGMGGGASLKQTSGTVDLTQVERDEDDKPWGLGFKFPWQKEKEAAK